ncbi:mitochondrial import translocase, subunit Tom22 [Trichodelitschia bisporula]|uniref:Mitochondrial import translocase, subunit Tom22 n=1 Tax=Trichodelitschia bisporula TaxID=703511 RepID=A0A6G1HP67_9PEZI|nr:mitochondrial import translocase, subunit Tom22 [Trichodelitschia bisporula]
MVKLEEVADEDLTAPQTGPLGGDDDWNTDDDDNSDASSTTSSIDPDETFLERLSALQSMIPAKQRQAASSAVAAVTGWVKGTLGFGGKALWVISTSSLLLGVPWALAYAEEQQMIEMEREMKMQQSANDLLTPGATTQAAPRM